MYGDGGVEPDPYRGHEFPEIRNVPADTHPHDSVRLSSLLGGEWHNVYIDVSQYLEKATRPLLVPPPY